MGNLDFSNNAGFSAYCVALVVIGLVMFVLAAASAARGAKASAAITTAIVGLAALGYGIYLIFVFQGGTYFISYYVFVLPVLVTMRLLQGRAAGRRPKGHQARAKQFKQQVKAGEAAYQQQMAAAGPAQQSVTAKAEGGVEAQAAGVDAAPTATAAPAASTATAAAQNQQ